jgi:hypothetical protein
VPQANHAKKDDPRSPAPPHIPGQTFRAAAVENSEGKGRWFQTTHWIEIDGALAFISVGQPLMESIWTPARFHYLGEKPESLVAWTNPEYDEVMKRFRDDQQSGIFTEHMNMELLYYAPPDEAPEAASRGLD